MSPDKPDTTIFESLQAARDAHRMPPRLRELTEEFSQRVLALLFPHFQSSETTEGTPEAEFEAICALACETIAPLVDRPLENIHDIFLSSLTEIHRLLLLDAEAMFESDPAAESLDEVIFAYPGFYAIALYRVAHCFYKAQVPVFPRLISEIAHRHTGIDIHPGATIGERFSIDHGTGIVIGETTTIGANVRLYQGVTLGALAVKKSLSETKRHPTLENDVIVYAGATILGGKTIVGRGSIIGGNVWLTHSVPPESVVTFASQTQKLEEAPLEFYL